MKTKEPDLGWHPLQAWELETETLGWRAASNGSQWDPQSSLGPPPSAWGQTSPPPSGAPTLQGGAQGHSSSLVLASLVHGASVFPASERLLSLSLAVEPAEGSPLYQLGVGRTTGRCGSEGMKASTAGTCAHQECAGWTSSLCVSVGFTSDAGASGLLRRCLGREEGPEVGCGGHGVGEVRSEMGSQPGGKHQDELGPWLLCCL